MFFWSISIYVLLLFSGARKTIECVVHGFISNISYRIAYHITSYQGVSCRIVSCHISYHIISHHIVLYCIVSYLIVSYRIVSYRIKLYLVISYHIVFYLIVSYHIISYFSYCIASHRIVSPPLFRILSEPLHRHHHRHLFNTDYLSNNFKNAFQRPTEMCLCLQCEDL